MTPQMTQWFAFEERDLVERALPVLRELKVSELRTLFSWADWLRPGGREWFDWFIPKLSSVPGLRLVPCLFYTPSDLSMKDQAGKTQTSYPPMDASTYAAFVEEIIIRYGAHFDWVELWNEPNWKPYYDDALDPDWSILTDMVRQASEAAHRHKKKAALGGMAPLELPWVTRVYEKGMFEHLDAVCFHYAPSWPNQHRRWMPLETEVNGLRALMRGLGKPDIEVWLDEAGISTLTPNDSDEKSLEGRQIEFFDMVSRLSVDRSYWYCMFDQKADRPTDDMLNTGTPVDITAYHFGLVREDGSKKPLYEHWQKQVGGP